MTRLSNRQYPMLRTFINSGVQFYMTEEEAKRYDQRPFRSMLIQEWIAFRPGHGFHITREGRAAWQEFQDTSILRVNPLLPLTKYFKDPTVHHRVQRKGPGRVHAISSGVARSA